MATENETLLKAVLKQLKVTKIDFSILASEIGATTPSAARKRWERLHKKLMGSKSGKSSGIQKSVKSAAKIYRRTNNSKVDEVASGSDADRELLATPPPRKLPARKARVVSFYAESTDDEHDMHEEANIDAGAMQVNEENFRE